MNKRFNKYGWLISAILEVLLGIILIFKPKEFTDLILNCIGIVMIVYGGINAIEYFRTSKELAIFEHNLSKGILSILAGILLMIFKSTLVESITVIYGIIILVGSIVKVQFSADLARMEDKLWLVTLIEAIISIILGILIIKNPFSAIKTLWGFIGISMIIEGVFNGINAGYWFTIRKKIEKIIEN